MQSFLARQYERTMREAYAFARQAAADEPCSAVLDCGCGGGHERIATFAAHGQGNAPFQYTGLEWHRSEVEAGRAAGLEIVQADLNEPLPVDSASQDCVIAYSVIEHLLMPCAFLAECERVLRPGGRLVVLTPNISTYFTAIQILAGEMPSSGPHPDDADGAADGTPQHRHLVVFSYAELRKRLSNMFEIEAERGFGYYPFPMVLQPLLERLDPRHCHQMVFVSRKPSER